MEQRVDREAGRGTVKMTTSLGGLEPATFPLTSKCANRLRHRDCLHLVCDDINLNSDGGQVNIAFRCLRLQLFVLESSNEANLLYADV